MKRISLITSFVLFIVLCATFSYWVMQFIQPPVRRINAPQLAKPVASAEAVAGLFGGALAQNSSYQLKGYVRANPMNQSEAIIAVDGKAAQAVTVDTEVSPGVKLTEVHPTYVMLLDNGVSKRIELPQNSKASMQISVDDNTQVRSPVPAGASQNTVNAPGFNPEMAKRMTRGRGLVSGEAVPNSGPNPTPNFPNPANGVAPGPVQNQ